jgi:hypothetical protein
VSSRIIDQHTRVIATSAVTEHGCYHIGRQSEGHTSLYGERSQRMEEVIARGMRRERADVSSAHNTAGAVHIVTIRKLGFIHAQGAETAGLLSIRHIDTQSRPIFVYIVCAYSEQHKNEQTLPTSSISSFTLLCNLALNSIYPPCTGFAYPQSAARLNEHAIMCVLEDHHDLTLTREYPDCPKPTRQVKMLSACAACMQQDMHAPCSTTYQPESKQPMNHNQHILHMHMPMLHNAPA